ncbi:membrane protein insertase YidC [bacterium]|nr:membrane protein insertase YidC [bacterium]
MDRDFIIGMVLIFVILFAWQTFAPKPEKPEEPVDAGPVTDAEVVAAPGAATPTATPEAIAAAPPESTADGDAAPAATAPSVGVLPPVVIETEDFRAELTNVGGRVRSFRLKKFMDKAGDDGQPVEMVSMPGSGLYPMATYWVGSGPAMSGFENYEIVDKGELSVTFARTGANGFHVAKLYEASPNNYKLTLTVTVTAPADAGAQGRLSITDYHEMVVAKGGLFSPNLNIVSHLAFVGGDLEREPMEKAPGTTYPSRVIWAGFESTYFLSAIAPSVSENTQAQALAPKNAGEPVPSVITMPEATIPAGGTASFEFTGYFGPKSEEPLFAAGHSFDQALDFGWFTAISKILVRVLQAFHRWTGNWGVAIIIVTFIIKTLLLPLTQKSYKSMKEMSSLQPEMAALREKYKDNREKLNAEMMNLYKVHKINPAAGCIPLLIQLPIFLAFYRALYGTIELRHSPFVLWIHDLSAPDPFYVLPIIMGVTMLVTQLLTPTSADPMQQKIMLAMPVIFTVMFLSFPAGLVLYWLVNNILTIFQQMYLRRHDPKKPPVPPKAAEAAA